MSSDNQAAAGKADQKAPVPCLPGDEVMPEGVAHIIRSLHRNVFEEFAGVE